MSAYVISELTVSDPEAMERYSALAHDAIEQFGGRFLAAALAPVQLEGERPDGERVILIEFESAERAREWYASEAYAKARAVGEKAMSRRMTLIGD